MVAETQTIKTVLQLFPTALKLRDLTSHVTFEQALNFLFFFSVLRSLWPALTGQPVRLGEQRKQLKKQLNGHKEEGDEWRGMMTDRNKVPQCLVTAYGLCLQDLQVAITFIGPVYQKNV